MAQNEVEIRSVPPRTSSEQPWTAEERKLFEVFLRYPRKLYREDRYWVPEFLIERRRFHDPRYNPELNHIEVNYLVAYRNGEPAGRMTAHINRRHDEVHGPGAGFFGFFEAEDDVGIATALLSAAEEWLRTKGCTRIIGPANFSSNTTWGMLVDGRFEDAATVLMPYNPRYYARMFERRRYEKWIDLLAYEVTNWAWPNETIQKMAAHARENGVTLRPVRLDSSGFETDVEAIRLIYNSAWADNDGFIPLTETEFAYIARTFQGIFHPDLCYIAEIDGTPVGMSLSFPDVNQVLLRTGGKMSKLLWHMWFRRSHLRLGEIVTRVRTAMIGVLPEYRRRGVEALFYEKTFETCLANGCYSAELSWVDSNQTELDQSIRSIGGRPYKRFRVWQRSLEQDA